VRAHVAATAAARRAEAARQAELLPGLLAEDLALLGPWPAPLGRRPARTAARGRRAEDAAARAAHARRALQSAAPTVGWARPRAGGAALADRLAG
jgi:hypothetical protein